MNNIRIPDEIVSQATEAELEQLNDAWDHLGRALPEAPSTRMSRHFRKTIRRQRFTRWTRPLTWASMAACLVAGITIGRIFVPPPKVPLSPEPDFALRSTSAPAVRLQAMVTMRRTGSPLSAETRQQLGRMISDHQANTGLRLAAVDTLAAHTDQDEVLELIRALLSRRDQYPPLIYERLKEIGVSAPQASI